MSPRYLYKRGYESVVIPSLRWKIVWTDSSFHWGGRKRDASPPIISITFGCHGKERLQWGNLPHHWQHGGPWAGKKHGQLSVKWQGKCAKLLTLIKSSTAYLHSEGPIPHGSRNWTILLNLLFFLFFLFLLTLLLEISCVAGPTTNVAFNQLDDDESALKVWMHREGDWWLSEYSCPRPMRPC